MANRITKITRNRYGTSASDTSITEHYIVTTQGPEVSPFEVCRPDYDGNYSRSVESDPFPKLFESYKIFDPDTLELLYENVLFKVLPGGISASVRDPKANQWDVSVTYSQTPWKLENLSNLTFGSKTYTKVAPGAYEVKASFSPSQDAVISQKPDIEFTNAAFELYDPAEHQYEFDSTILSFTLRQSDEFDYVEALKLRGTVNSQDTTILGIPALRHQARLLSITPTLNLDEAGDQRWYCNYELEIMPENETHNIRLQNQGWYAKFDGVDKPAREILVSDISDSVVAGSDTDKPVTKQRLLGMAGELLPDGGSPIYYEFRVYQEKDWSTLLEIPEVAVDASGDDEFLDGQT